MKIIKDIFYKEGQALDIYLPDSDSFNVFLYFHGGGLETGSKDSAKHFAPYLTERKIAVVSADYIMYQKAKYPDFLTDSAEAVAWVMKNIGAYGKREGLYIGGSSAGGYISQMLCFDKKYLGAHGIKPTDITGFIHDAGQPTCHFNVLRERGIDSRRVIVDESCSLYHVGEDKEYPPMLIIYSDSDMQNRPEQTVLLASTLKHFGHTENVTVKMMHGRHCQYVAGKDENGVTVFGQMVYEYIYR